MKAGHMLENRNFISMLGCVYGSESIVYILRKYWLHHTVSHFLSVTVILHLSLSLSLSLLNLI
jgi:hypothetical protein